ncbi:MAG TPA: alkaline phosphatase family protein [Acidimicrobiales bacterium]|nr:alkaline phosphatase family protein [Acidimicrobiales bacterium]
MDDALPIARTPVTRRRVLQAAAVTAATTAVAPLLPDAASAGAADATQQELARQNIKHIVFLMMENRSFDHLFGTLSGVRGFDDRSVARPDGGNIFEQYDPTTNDYELPFRLTESNNPSGDTDLSHNWVPQHASLNNGANDNWLSAHLQADGVSAYQDVMGYLTRADAPYHHAMADAFTICDNYFCSVLGPTYPNRLMWQMGSIDPEGKGGGPLLTTDENVFVNNGGQGVFTYETFPERLTRAGITWKAYTDQASNHLLNMFPAFEQYNAPAAAGGTAGATNYLNGTSNDESNAGLLADISAGTLPQVSWIFPTVQSTEHPGDGPINNGPQYYEPIITALMQSPSWKDTVLLLTYDENDGYFDHVPPPQPPPGTPGEFLTAKAFGYNVGSTDPTTGKTTPPSDPSYGIAGPVGLGFRVPMLVISPWTVGGYVDSELFDHTSGLKLVETVFGTPDNGVTPRGIVSDWRYALVGDLTSTFDFTNPVLSVPQAVTSSLAAAFQASQLLLVTNNSGAESPVQGRPGADGTMPTQEPGGRHRRGPAPTWTQAPTPQLPEGTPALLLGAGLATALAMVAAKRVTSGASDATHAGGWLARARRVEHGQPESIDHN